jgi:gamma-glutamyl hercynylcysteine S-oxide hydrolase
MCRHVAYMGPAVSLYDLLWTPEFSLLEQASTPRQQRFGRVNADGYGIGWYARGRTEPVRYRRNMPMWADSSFASVAGATTSECVVAAVRSATVGTPVDESCVAPFTWRSLLWSHNGVVTDPVALRKGVTHLLPPECLDALAPVDSALLFGLTVAAVQAGECLPAALTSTVLSAREHSSGRFNLLASDGGQIAATVCGDTLYVRSRPTELVIASEPFDSARDWEPLPDESVAIATATQLDVRPLGH